MAQSYPSFFFCTLLMIFSLNSRIALCQPSANYVNEKDLIAKGGGHHGGHHGSHHHHHRHHHNHHNHHKNHHFHHRHHHAWHHWYWHGGIGGKWGNRPGYFYDPNYYYDTNGTPSVIYNETTPALFTTELLDPSLSKNIPILTNEKKYEPIEIPYSQETSKIPVDNNSSQER